MNHILLKYKAKHFKAFLKANLVFKLSSSSISILATREAAFVQSITAAGIIHAIAKLCSSGQEMFCTCEKIQHKLGKHYNRYHHTQCFARHKKFFTSSMYFNIEVFLVQCIIF